MVSIRTLSWPGTAAARRASTPSPSETRFETSELTLMLPMSSARSAGGNGPQREPTTRISLGVNLPATETEFGSTGDPLELSVEYFDNLGTSQNISIEFTPTVPGAPGSSNTWTLVLTDSASAGAVVGEYTVVFDDTRGSGGRR